MKCSEHEQRSPTGVPPFKQSIPERSGKYILKNPITSGKWVSVTYNMLGIAQEEDIS